MQYRRDIQGLRSIAVLFVFLFHINPTLLPGGFIGVDVFFVISGFLIASIILNQKEKGNFSFLQFYKNRIKRIVPAYYFLLLAVAVGAIFIYLGVDIVRFRLALLHADIFNSNAYFSSADTYFGAASSENPLLHTWTLAVEMKFYIFLPMLLVWVKKKWLPGLVSVLTVALFAYSIISINNGNKGAIYFSLLARTPEFLIGVLSSFFIQKKRNIKPVFGAALNFAGFISLFVSALFINENSAFPGALALLPCLGTALIIIFPYKYTLPVLTNKPMVFMGEISYSIYLWHWPIMAFVRYYYNISEFTAVQMIFVIVLTISTSLFSYYFVENFFRKAGSLKLWGSISLLLVLNILIGNYIVRLNSKVEHIPLVYTAPSMGLESHSGSFKHAEIFGDTTKDDRILLLGDSHASCMKPYMDYIGKRHHFSFKTITNDTYAAIPGIPREEFTSNRFYHRYENLLKYSEELIENSRIIILTIAGASETRNEEAIVTLINNLKSDQVLLFLSDYPTLDKNPVRINRDFIKDPNRRNIYIKTYAEPGGEILSAINSSPNVHFVDLSGTNIFDTAPFHNDTLMYYDEGHLNFYGSIQYARHTEEEFMKYFDSAKAYIKNQPLDL